MAPTAQALHAHTGLGKHLTRHGDMRILSAVAGAQQRYVRTVQPEILGPAAFHKGQCLKCLQRGPGEGVPMRIAHLGGDVAVPAGYGNGTQV